MMQWMWRRKKWTLMLMAVFLTISLTEAVWGWIQDWTMEMRQEKVIMIDAGHGGVDPGAVSTDGMAIEKEINLAIALKLQAYLEEAGYIVVMTRMEDETLSVEGAKGSTKTIDMKERKRLIEESGADLMVSIHQNSFPESKYWGPQVFYQKRSVDAAALALLVQEELNSFTAPESNRQAKGNDSYYILNESSMPAILVECGFVTNSKEAENLRDETYQKKVAWGIYSGIEKYLQSEAF